MVSAYGSLAYAQTLAHVGTAQWMSRASGALLSRRIADRPHHDLIGPYPWADFDDWSSLHADFNELSALQDPPVSVVSVISPTTKASKDELQRTFPDHLVPFKEHQLLDLTGDLEQSFRPGHRRKMRRARSSVSVDVVPEAANIAAEWVSMYAHLVRRHRVTGAANFPESALRAQLAPSGAMACVARLGTKAIGIITFYQDGDIAAYHLGAFSPEGYEHEVAFALFPAAFEYLASIGVTLVNLGGGAGNSVDADDGLVQFKRGWATHAEPSLIGGRVLDRVTYAALTNGLDHGFFPAYRGDHTP
jgi:hypothetical protein